MLTSLDYMGLYRTCVLTTDLKKLQELDFIANAAIEHQGLYEKVEDGCFKLYGLAVPWPLIAAIHFRESAQSFKRHLHNGDPLTERTVRVPKGRPATGNPPFTWIESAVDAFSGLWAPDEWDWPGCLEFIERYNGMGYPKHGVNTPYLWDYTNQYTSGLYRADGVFDPLKTESRPGAVAILKTMETKGVALAFAGMDSSAETVH